MSSTSKKGDPLRIVVLGYIVRCPLGGMTWHYLHYVLGLERLGHEVYFIEDSDEYPECCYDPIQGTVGPDPTVGLKYATDVFQRVDFGNRWAYFDAHSDRWYGPLGDRAVRICESADVVINISGICRIRPWLAETPIRIFIDTDPAFEQVRQLTVPQRRIESDLHNCFFTFGENVAAGTSLVPDAGRTWLATRQPIVLDRWPVTPGPVDGNFTTVMQWDSYKTREFNGLHLGMKSMSLRDYVDLPDASEERLEIALGRVTSTYEDLTRHGWRIVDPLPPTKDPWTYRDYIRGSKGEFTVAKHGYVAARTGWFSERSAAYLASGRPVVMQDTGSSIEADGGLFRFSSFEEAVAGLKRASTDYERQCRAARAVAEEYFDSDDVLSDLLENAIVAVGEAPGTSGSWPNVRSKPVWSIGLDFPISPTPRWGYGKPPHGRLTAMLEAGADRYRPWFAQAVASWDELRDVPLEGEWDRDLYWLNGWLSILDGLAVYTFAAQAANVFVEIGSGFSTRFAHRGVAAAARGARIVSIDPEPRAEIAELCDEVRPEPLEETDLSLFTGLREGDVVFLDGSHRSFTNSDVTTFFVDVLPELRPNVIVGLHDIFLPDDYPPAWSNRFYSEQYLLAAHVLSGDGGSEILLPMRFCTDHLGLDVGAEQIFEGLPDDVDRSGTSFWMRTP